MTEVMDSILNGVEGEEGSPMNDETIAGDKAMVIAEDQEDKGDESDNGGTTGEGLAGVELDDTTDSILSHPGANLIITTDDEREQTEANDEDDESKLEIDGQGANENGDEANMDISAIKMEDVDLDEVEEQNSNQSAADSESALVISTEGSEEKKILQNGVEPNTNEENSSCSSSGENSKGGYLGTSRARGTLESSASLNKGRQQMKSFSIADGGVIANELGEQIDKVNAMLALKEQEWNALLQLKKHMEYALEQVKCTQRMAKVQENDNGPMSTTDIMAAINLITCEPDIKSVLGKARKRIEESIGNTNMDNATVQLLFPFGHNAPGSSAASSSKAGSSTTKGEREEGGLSGVFPSASAVLQKICERKRKAMDDAQPPPLNKGRRLLGSNAISQAASQAAVTAQANRLLSRGGNAQTATSQSQSQQSMYGSRPLGRGTRKSLINMNPERRYAKILEECVALANAEKLQKENPAIFANPATPTVPHIINTRTLVTSRPKNGKPAARQATSSNSLLITNPTPGGSGTLAKMLSPSAHSTSASTTRGDGSNNASQKYSSKLPSSEANLSLANLLATSKVESKVSLAKVKKERMRDEESSHVPSQQQAEQVPICQGCNLSRAQFVCAGCANQWYCSRECQVAAWDEHSEICSG